MGVNRDVPDDVADLVKEADPDAEVMNSVQRILSYSDVPQEAPLDMDEDPVIKRQVRVDRSHLGQLAQKEVARKMEFPHGRQVRESLSLWTATPSGELTGAAQRMIVGKPPTWVSFNGGVTVFLQHLRQSLGKPQIPEATEFLNKYFRNSRRRMGESINDYITRKSETYWRACQALRTVMPKPKRPAAELRDQWSAPSQGWNSRRSSWAADEVQDAEAEDTHEDQNNGETWTRASSTWSSWNWSSSGSWGNSSYYPYYSSWTWKSQAPDDRAGNDNLVEILPEFVQAWYLLADAGLTSQERNLIHTAVAGDYTLARVSTELRAQHGESDHRRREPSGQAYLGDELEEQDNENFDEDVEAEVMNMDDLNEEGSALWTESQKEIESAHAVLKDARRTLRAARERQHQVKLARKYFRPDGAESRDRPKDDSGMTCLKCGKIGHRARNCPEQASQSSREGGAKQLAPFVCYAESSEEALAAGPTTQEAVNSGHCVIDGGATRTLGSVKALEMIFKKNLERHGDDRVEQVDTADRPVFGFGNSTEGQCLSTIHLGANASGKPGKLVIHALDEGEGPVLLSIDALRKLDAVIDFRRNLVVFRELDPCKVISLKRSQTGHQLLDLTADLYVNARGTNKPVPSLQEFL
ncbi:hypothetical protein AK812_SmicGene36749 [Symbiodinium microadriaticum]|uniref:Uncharacterized protein n=1 Tax=Symbiodinium microadriaticum TaxID=2951 RepID=A0A1Q9CI99_SYMMI|nr:hypothetical protein AK812_SmicGene36749 [Symbiodinium microadriaticum]CAE7585669.1 unnamed protein product [Symbiodinium microadriaticum]